MRLPLSFALRHARWLRVQAIPAWTCFCMPFEGAGGRTYYRMARMSDTEMGRRLARLLDREWCPRCGRFLNYRPDLGICLSCHLSDLYRLSNTT